MKIVSINLKPNLSEGVHTIEGNVVVDGIPVGGIMKIELEVEPLGPIAAIGGSVSSYYSFRAQLKNSQIDSILSVSKRDDPCLKIPIEDLHRFSGFLDFPDDT